MSAQRRLLIVALLASALLTPGAAAAAPPGPTDFLSGFLLVNGNSDKCLTTGARNAVVQNACGGESRFRWRMRLVTLTGLFQIQNVRGGRCLTISDDVRRAVQGACDDGLSRRWRLLDGPGDTFLMRAAAGGRCLTADRDATVSTDTCDPHRSRLWTGELAGGSRP
jgi:hypothetical protein